MFNVVASILTRGTRLAISAQLIVHVPTMHARLRPSFIPANLGLFMLTVTYSAGVKRRGTKGHLNSIRLHSDRNHISQYQEPTRAASSNMTLTSYMNDFFHLVLLRRPHGRRHRIVCRVSLARYSANARVAYPDEANGKRHECPHFSIQRSIRPVYIKTARGNRKARQCRLACRFITLMVCHQLLAAARILSPFRSERDAERKAERGVATSVVSARWLQMAIQVRVPFSRNNFSLFVFVS